MKKTKSVKKVVILGGGLAGLSAGYELSKAGINVIVLEKCEQVGGLAKTVEIDGLRFDTGPHRWYSKSELANNWMHKLLDGELIKVPRLTRIYFDKKFFYYPIRLTNVLMGIGFCKALNAVFDYIAARVRVHFLKPRLLTMEDGYISQFGRTLYKIFFKRYSEKLWGASCSKISIDWVGQRTRGINILTMLKEAMFKSKDVVSFVDEFSYPEGGIGCLSERLAKEIKKREGEVITSAEVINVNHKNNKINSIVILTKKKTKTIIGDSFISSIPLDELVGRLSPKADKRILSYSTKLSYRDAVQVILFVKRNNITTDTWIYVHPKEIPFMRIMEMDNWSDKLSPHGTTSLVFEIACNKGDDIWKKSDKEVTRMTIESYIREFKWIKKEDIIGTYVHRVEKEYPVYHLGYKNDVGRIKKYLAQFKNLQIAGRNGIFRYNNMDHSVEMGLYAAWNIIKGKKKYDIESVNIEREYLEEKRVENVEDELLETHQV